MKRSKIKKAEAKAEVAEENAGEQAKADNDSQPAKSEKQVSQKEITGPKEEKEATAEKKESPTQDPLIKMQTMEWHALTLAGAKMDEELKKERLAVIMGELAKTGTELKKISLKKFGLSPKTVDARLDMTNELVKQILSSGKRFDMSLIDVSDNPVARSALTKYEANEWKLLDQREKTKDAAKSENQKRRETEQEKMFKAADSYCQGATDLAANSEKCGIPQDIVGMRTEQRLKTVGEDPDLENMRNPSNDIMMTGSAAFLYFVKQLIEKLAKAIKQIITAKAGQAQASVQASVKAAQPQATVKVPTEAEVAEEKGAMPAEPAAVRPS